MKIRNETKSDGAVVAEVTKAAFENHPHSNQTEHYIINALRAANALTVSLVAELDGRVVGHIAFSPLDLSDGSQDWYGLGPISVLPEYQRRGVGKAMMHEGISILKGMGGQGCVLVGDPGYYERFGFRNMPELVYEGIPQVYVLALVLGDQPACGVVTFHAAFGATE